MSVVERYVWRNEAKPLSGMNLDEMANPPTKRRANNDVRVENDPSNETPASHPDASV